MNVEDAKVGVRIRAKPGTAAWPRPPAKTGRTALRGTTGCISGPSSKPGCVRVHWDFTAAGNDVVVLAEHLELKAKP